MRYLLALILLLLLAAPALADAEVHQGKNWVRITALPCSNPEMRALIEQAGGDPEDFRAAAAEWDGKGYVGCWRPDWQEHTVSVFSTAGGRWVVPFGALKAVKEA